MGCSFFFLIRNMGCNFYFLSAIWVVVDGYITPNITKIFPNIGRLICKYTCIYLYVYFNINALLFNYQPSTEQYPYLSKSTQI